MSKVIHLNIATSSLTPSTPIAATVAYDSHCLVGEVVRNCCVELGIVPDTVDGVTRNVTVSHVVTQHGVSTLLTAAADISIEEAGLCDGDWLQIEPLP